MSIGIVESSDNNFQNYPLSSSQDSVTVEDVVLEIFNEMRTPVLRHLLWLNLRQDQAEDVLQEAFLRLYQHLSRSDFSRHNIRGWTWRVAHNLGVNMRIADNRRERGGELALDEVSSWLADTRPDPEQQLQQTQSNRRVAMSIRGLNARERQCVNLRAQGLGYRQIATVLGIGRSTVADTMNRVTTFLKSQRHLS